MATNPANTRLILDPKHRMTNPTGADALSGHARFGAWAAAGVLSLGSLVDLAVLWGLQRQDQPQWEFVAIANTLDAFPRFALAVAFFYAALHFGRTASLVGYRILASALIVLGLAGAGLGALMVTDYFALARMAGDQAQALANIRFTAIKSVGLSAAFALLLIPLGIRGLRRPGSR